VLKWLDREPAFPIFLQAQGWDYMQGIPETYQPGRVIISGHTEGDQVIRQDFIDQYVRAGDIVYIPLYQGGCEDGGRGVSERLPCYARNLDAMGKLAGKCRGVILGNAAAEVTFKHLSSWEGACVMAAEFVYETSIMCEAIGHRVWYGLVDFDAAIDCYVGGACVRDTVKGFGNALITFCGYTMFGGHIPASEAIYHIQADPVQCPQIEGDPWPILSEYIAGAEWYTGVGGKSGMACGNDRLLSSHGFKAGIMGQF
jgi:hypothetical protein